MITARGAGRRRPSRVTLRDVARLAGVSISVVSRELNADPVLRARDDTRQRIHDAARALDYTPSHAARALRLAKAGAVGLIVPDVTNPVFGDLIRGIEDATEAAGLQLLIGGDRRIRLHAQIRRQHLARLQLDRAADTIDQEADAAERGHGNAERQPQHGELAGTPLAAQCAQRQCQATHAPAP